MKWFLFKDIFYFTCECREILECKNEDKLVSVSCKKCGKNNLLNPARIFKTHNHIFDNDKRKYDEYGNIYDQNDSPFK